MEAELDTVPATLPLVEHARACLGAVGSGYLRFARMEAGLFRTAFASPDRVEKDTDVAKAGRSGLHPFQRLVKALEEPDRAGGLPSARATGAEERAWCGVKAAGRLIMECCRCT